MNNLFDPPGLEHAHLWGSGKIKNIVMNRNALRTNFFAQVGIKSLKYRPPELSVHQST